VIEFKLKSITMIKNIYIIVFLISLNTIGQTILFEDFNLAEGVAVPEGWSNEIEQGSFGWSFSNPGNREMPAPFDDRFAIFDGDTYGKDTISKIAVLTSPVLSLDDQTTTVLKFDHQFRGFSESYGIIEFYDGSDWITVFNTGFENIGYSEDSLLNVAVSDGIDLSLYELDPENFQFRFKYFGDWEYWWAIDNVSIEEANLIDLAVTEFIFDDSPRCFDFKEEIKVIVKNTGLDRLEFEDFPEKATVVLSIVEEGNLVYEDEIQLEVEELIVGQELELVFDSIEYNFGTGNIHNINAELVFDLDENEINNQLTFEGSYSELYNFPIAESDFETDFETEWTTSAVQLFGYPSNNIKIGNFKNELDHPNQQCLKFDLYGNSIKEWIVSPKFVCTENTKLDFSWAITSDETNANGDFTPFDVLRVFAILSCDESDNDFIRQVNGATEAGTCDDERVLLAEFAGETMSIGFFVDDGPFEHEISMDLFLDNIEISELEEIEIKLEVNSDLHQSLCPSEVVLPEIFIINQGTTDFDFENDSLRIDLNIVGPEQYNYFEIVEQGTLAVGDTLVLSIDESFDFLEIGTYKIVLDASYKEIVSNTHTFNYESHFVTSVPSVVKRFDLFTGNNLSELYLGWYEGKGDDFEQTSFSEWTVDDYGNEFAENRKSAKLSYGNKALEDWIMTNAYSIEENTVLSFDAILTNESSKTITSFEEGEAFVVLAFPSCADPDTLFKFDANTVFLIEEMTHKLLLEKYIGQDVRFAFIASQNAPDSDLAKEFFLDNIWINPLPEMDLAIGQLTSPIKNNKCFGVEALTFEINNLGLKDWDFEEENVQLIVEVVGVQDFTDTIDINENKLGFCESMEFSYDGLLDLSTKGTHVVSVKIVSEMDTTFSNNNTTVFFNNQDEDYTLSDGIDFEKYDGENLSLEYVKWSEARGVGQPTDYENDSDWTKAFFANNSTDTNFVSMGINYWQNKKNEWVIGPILKPSINAKFSYDLALTEFGKMTGGQLGSDDLFQVMVSTDCGASFQAIKTYDANVTISNVGQKDTILLTDYVDQEIILAFYATEGEIDDEEDVDLFLDNVVLLDQELPAGNVGGIGLYSINDFCENNNVELIVQFTNYSPFTVSDFLVVTEITGVVNAMFVDTVDYPMEAYKDGFAYHTLFTTEPGEITVKVYTLLVDDLNVFNDTITEIVAINAYPKIDLGEDKVICDTVVLVPSVEGDYNEWFWSTEDEELEINVWETGRYIVEVGNNGCFVKDTIELSYEEPPVAEFDYLVNGYEVDIENESTNAQNFIWNFGDGEGFEENDLLVNHEYQNTGAYEIQLLALSENCGTDTIAKLIEIIDTSEVGLNAIDGLESCWTLKNNPVKEVLVLMNDCDENFYEEARIYSLDGKEIIFDNRNNAHSISVESLRSGIYFVVINADGNDAVLKFLKE